MFSTVVGVVTSVFKNIIPISFITFFISEKREHKIKALSLYSLDIFFVFILFFNRLHFT